METGRESHLLPSLRPGCPGQIEWEVLCPSLWNAVPWLPLKTKQRPVPPTGAGSSSTNHKQEAVLPLWCQPSKKPGNIASLQKLLVCWQTHMSAVSFSSHKLRASQSVELKLLPASPGFPVILVRTLVRVRVLVRCPLSARLISSLQPFCEVEFLCPFHRWGNWGSNPALSGSRAEAQSWLTASRRWLL